MSRKEIHKSEYILQKGSVQWLTITAMFMSINILLSISVFSIAVPGGHLYFNDVIINTAALLLDPTAAFLVGGVGSFLGDLLFYPAPMFVSLTVHGLQAAAVSYLSHRFGKRRRMAASWMAVLAGSIIMVVGYTLGRAYGYSTPEYAIMKLPFQIIQALVGAVASVVIVYPLGIGTIFRKNMQ